MRISSLMSSHLKCLTRLSNGQSLTVYLTAFTGILAMTTGPEEVGPATDQLWTAMAQVQLDQTPPVLPYHDVSMINFGAAQCVCFTHKGSTVALILAHCHQP